MLENGKAFAPPRAVAEGVRVRRRRGETSFVPVTPAHRSLLFSLNSISSPSCKRERETKLLLPLSAKRETEMLVPFIVFISIESATAIRSRLKFYTFALREEFLISTGHFSESTHATYIGQ